MARVIRAALLGFYLSFSWGVQAVVASKRLEVEQVLETSFEWIKELGTNSSRQLAYLDCQSFVQGLTFFGEDQKGQAFGPIHWPFGAKNCLSLMDLLIDYTHQGYRVCLKVEEETGKVQVWPKIINCQFRSVKSERHVWRFNLDN